VTQQREGVALRVRSKVESTENGCRECDSSASALSTFDLTPERRQIIATTWKGWNGTGHVGSNLELARSNAYQARFGCTFDYSRPEPESRTALLTAVVYPLYKNV
jgi:hypothetical protein